MLTDQASTPPLLGVPSHAGAGVGTLTLLPDSPAIDSGDDSNCPGTDRRGVLRPQDGDGDLIASCDIGAYELGDSDADGIVDTADNCLLVANPSQLDTDADGIGNGCDGDFNNDCTTNVVDLGILKANFFQVGDRVTDMSGDGLTNTLDLGLLKGVFLTEPGPSGIDNQCFI